MQNWKPVVPAAVCLASGYSAWSLLFSAALLLGASLPFYIGPASAQTNSLTIERVWVKDGKGNDSAVFAPDDAIQYTFLANNTYGHSLKGASIWFEVWGPFPGNQSNPAYRSILSYKQENVEIPVGRSGYYSPWTIPASAQPGTYELDVQIAWPADTGGYSFIGNDGRFSIPGSLATQITTYSTARGIPTTLPDNAAGPGGALAYKITVTNTSSVGNTNVIFTDQLPKEIFDILGTATTDHGSCTKAGSWPATTLNCHLGSLSSHETATISFTASIIVRNPDGTPTPPTKFTNAMYVNSDQQRQPTSSFVETAISKAVLSDQDYNKFVAALEGCTAPIIVLIGGARSELLATFVGFFADVVQELSDKSSPLNIAYTLASKELSGVELEKLSVQTGLGKEVSERAGNGPDVADCLWGIRSYFVNGN